MTQPAKPPKRPRSARDNARTAYRQSLLVAAEQVFVSSGFLNTKMTDIATAAGVAVGTLYNYFDSKEAIFEAIMAERSTAFRAELTPLLALPDPLERLRQVVRTACQHVSDNGTLFMLFLERGAASELDMERVGGMPMRLEYDRFLAVLHEAIQGAIDAGVLRSDVPANLQVAMLSGGMNGAFYAWFKRKRRGPIQSIADDLLTLFLSGASVPT
ncbi:MAG TPA: TetR/AcrR family transcriptional regulator [Polyangiales bacterium]